MVDAHPMGGSGCGHRTVGRCASCRTAICTAPRAQGRSCSPGFRSHGSKKRRSGGPGRGFLAGAAPTTMHNYVQHVSTFGAWLADRAPAVSSPAYVTRAVLEDWLLAVRSSGLAAASKANRVTAVRLFLEEQWQDGLAGLPRTAVIHVGEVPHNRSRRLPRGIEAPVFEQFIDPANLALLPCEQHRTVILLLAFTGLRVSSIVTLPRDALVVGSDNHP